jgi:hypothetical protein
MCIGEGRCHGDVAVDDEKNSGNGVFVTTMKNVPQVVKAAAVGT